MKRRVLILCTGNSARSQLAEALVNARLGDTWEAVSAGTQPAAAVNPFALVALAEVGIQTSGSHPKHLSGFIGQPFDVVITVCDDAAEHCPVWVGQGKRLHIGFPDPAAVLGDDATKLAAFRHTREAIIERLLPVLRDFPNKS
ncbi:MAG: arsenate reductase ArsC [Chloroflexi bacterium]|nr:arsenate reductase ArsC [Chloroflexota bacterium]MCC6895280.1 arsenate reductase ArsC [Anaerolineae bacterium]